jgi:hydroxymethylpyrimidine kinase/phosphomethylpyrimidine kinase
VVRWKNRCDYVTLSPIFDSISKAGYRSAFTREEIAEAARKGIIDEKVMALGGVTFNKMKEVTAMGFGGGMILGDAWNYHRVLSIAGSDSGGGAGIQADIKTISACGCYAATAITAITIQNTLGVHDVMKIPAEIVEKQISDVLDDIGADAIKIGMLTDEAVVEAVSRQLRRHADIPVVIDPVMVSTSGRQLIDTTAIHVMKSQLLPLATIITPNIPEAEILLDMSIKNKEDMQKAVCRLSTEYHTSVLLKGGHLEGDTLVDLFYDGTLMELPSMRIYSPNTHGTGCTLSSALASMIARKEPIDEAVRHAKDYVTHAIIAGAGYRLGRGKGSLCHLPIE